MTDQPPPARLAAVRALVMDFDGVHTDDRVTVDQDGRESVVCSRADGLGLERLRASGQYRLLILSKETNPVVAARAAKLRIPALQAVGDKVAALTGWLAQQGLAWSDVLYIGNDVNDLPALMRAGLSACPSDAVTPVCATVDWVVPAPGGRGALRAVTDALLDAAFAAADAPETAVQIAPSVAA
jgi:N-acylneuraminate cytidylyltransferase